MTVHDFFYKRRLIFSSTGHLLFLPIFPVLMSLTCLLFFRWWHSSLVKIHADIRGKNRKKISVSVLSKCDPIWFHYYVVVHDFLQQKVRLSGSSLTSKNFSTEHLLFLPKFPVLNILSLINVSLIKKKSCTKYRRYQWWRNDRVLRIRSSGLEIYPDTLLA